jgi:hypothetical protein
MKRRSERKNMTKKLRSRKNKTSRRTRRGETSRRRTRKGKTSRRTRRGETSRRRTRKGKTSRITRRGETSRRRTRKGKTSRRINKTSRRRSRKGKTSRRINKNKVYSGGGDLSDNITMYQKSENDCAFTRHMSWVEEGNFCMKKPASTHINQANIASETINKYILKEFVFESQLGELSDSELARNFYRSIKGNSFYICKLGEDCGSHYATTKTISGSNATAAESVALINELGQELDLTGGGVDKNKEIAKKIMRCVDTTGSPMLWAFPQSAFPEHGATPSVGQTKYVCIVGEGYVFQFVYYYIPIGSTVAAMIANGKSPLKGDRPDKKYADFVVRGFTKNLYLDGNDARSVTMQVFPTDITDIDNIEKADYGFRQRFVASEYAEILTGPVAPVSSVADSRPVTPTDGPSPTVSRVATPEEATAEQFKGKNPTSGYPGSKGSKGSKASQWVAAIEHDD